MKYILLFLIGIFLTGCSCDFWAPNWDKAATERKQYQQLKEQNIYYERIATALEKMATK